MNNYQLHLIGNGNLAASIAAHFATNNLTFTWFKPDEHGRHFLPTDEPAKKAICFFAIRDSAIPNIWDTLQGIHPESIYVHFSAAIGLRLGRLLSQTVCLHPMYAFPNHEIISLAKIPFSFQGESKHVFPIQDIFPKSNIVQLQIENPELYHLLGVFASNFQFALLAICEKLGRENALSPKDVKGLLLPIIQQTLSNYEQSDTLYAALSGPVKRGDESTIQKHEVALREVDPTLETIYKLLTDQLRNLNK
jgi:predicted short-subunit dehydrogenase-like oxidoreductase (DUF2520 family)